MLLVVDNDDSLLLIKWKSVYVYVVNDIATACLSTNNRKNLDVL